MKLIVASRITPAKPRRFFRDGKLLEVEMSPFVGVIGGKRWELCIGLMKGDELKPGKEDEYLCWTVPLPGCLVAAWRAMQILDRVVEVQRSTLQAVYYISRRGTLPRLGRYLDVVARSLPMGAEVDVESMRTRVLEYRVPREELEAMLKVCNNPENTVSVSAEELEDEVVRGIIPCTPEVRKVFDRAESGGEELRQIWTASRQPRELTDSFGYLQRVARVNRLCVLPKDEEMQRLGLMGLDQYIVYKTLRQGESTELHCAMRRHGKWGFYGHPVVRLKNGETRALLEVACEDERMKLRVRVINVGRQSTAIPDSLATMTVAEALELSPRMVGVDFDEDDVVDEESRRRGYILTETVWQQIAHWLKL